VIATLLAAIVFLYQKHYPEDGLTTGRITLVNIV